MIFVITTTLIVLLRCGPLSVEAVKCCDHWEEVTTIAPESEDITSLYKWGELIAFGTENGHVHVWQYQKYFTSYRPLIEWVHAERISDVMIINATSQKLIVVGFDSGTLLVECIGRIYYTSCTQRVDVIHGRHYLDTFHEKPIHFLKLDSDWIYIAAHDKIFYGSPRWIPSALSLELIPVTFSKQCAFSEAEPSRMRSAITSMMVSDKEVMFIALHDGGLFMHYVTNHTTSEVRLKDDILTEPQTILCMACYENNCHRNGSLVKFVVGTSYGYIFQYAVNLRTLIATRRMLGTNHSHSIISIGFVNATTLIFNKETSIGFLDILSEEGGITTLGEHHDLVLSVFYDTESSRLISAGLDRKIKIWRIAQDPEVKSYKHRGQHELPQFNTLTQPKTRKQQYLDDLKPTSPWKLFQQDVKQIMEITMKEFLYAYEHALAESNSDAYNNLLRWLRALTYTRSEIDEIMEKLEDAMSDHFMEF